jgi:hypothetical protein
MVRGIFDNALSTNGTRKGLSSQRGTQREDRERRRENGGSTGSNQDFGQVCGLYKV